MFANGGHRVESYVVEQITDRNDEVIYTARPMTVCSDCDEQAAEANAAPLSNGTEDFEEADSLQALLDGNEQTGELTEEPLPIAEAVIDPRIAFIVDSVLQDVIKHGTGIKAKELGRNDLAGKTGTTNGPTDAWFSGYHPELVATAWLGFDDNRLLGRREFGDSAALPVWMDFMKTQLPGLPKTNRKRPEGITAVRIDRLSGERATAGNNNTICEYFREEMATNLQSRTGKNNHSDRDTPSYSEELF